MTNTYLSVDNWYRWLVEVKSSLAFLIFGFPLPLQETAVKYKIFGTI